MITPMMMKVDLSAVATPDTAQVAAVVGTSDSNGQLDNATGGLTLGNSVTKVDRYKIDSTISYTLADASAAYNPANVNLTSATKTFLHMRRPSGRDVAIIYDNFTLGESSSNTATGAQPIMLDSFYRGCVCPNEFVNNSPATQQSKSGNIFTFRKGKQTGATFGGDAMMTMVVAYTNGRMGGDFLTPASTKFSADAITYGNPTGTTESVRLYLPAASITDTPPEVSTFAPIGYRGVIVKEASPYVAALKIDALHTINSLAFSVSFSGTGDFVLNGWEAGTYAIARNGVNVAENVGVGSDGVLKFSSGSGAIQISQTGAVPPDPPPTDTLDVKVRAKGGAAIATIRGESLDYQTGCDVMVRNLASQVVASGSSATGPTKRTIALTGLAGGTTFNASAGCGMETGSATFTSESVIGSRVISVEVKRPVGVQSLLVEYGTTAALGNTASAVCSGSTCQASLPALPRGAVYFVKVNMRDAGQQTIRGSAVYRVLQ